MSNIRVDSRLVKKGDTFIALRGVGSDGHSYVQKAIENGAVKIIAEEGSYSVETVIVKDTREYLTNYLKEHYSSILNKMTIVGITGTNGKTTTAFLLHNALNMCGKKCAYIGTVGFYVKEKIKDLPNTTPDILEIYEMFIEAYNRGCKYIAMEVSSQGISYRRIEGINFDYTVFTNLTQDHLDYHKTMENYALAKQELFKQLKSDGKAIINIDDKYKDYFMLKNNKNITYGFDKSDYQVINYRLDSLKTTFTYRKDDNDYSIVTSLIGKYNIYNLMAVITLLNEIGINPRTISKVCGDIEAPEGRMSLIKYRSNSIIIDYAHTPDAITKIIGAMKEVSRGRIFTVFGCTGDRDRTKRPIMTKIVTDNSKYAILTNDDPHNEEPKDIFKDMTEGITNTNYIIIEDRKEAILKGISLLKSNDILLILGKGHEEFMVIKDKKIPFNDRKVVNEYLEKIKTM